jgi:hypothetical protein
LGGFDTSSNGGTDAFVTKLALACPGYSGDPRIQVVGTPGNDTLTGTAGKDIICGLGGDDTLRGQGGCRV